MPPKELKSHKPFTGFMAYYENGKVVKERENFFSKLLHKNCATSWAEINREKLVALELIWNDVVKTRIDKTPTDNSFNRTPVMSSEDWFFSQKGYYDMGSRKIFVIARNIGYRDGGITIVASVIEKTGAVQIYQKKV